VRRKWIITTTAAGAVMVGGLAVAGPALAEDPTGTSAVERITEVLAGLVDDGSITQEQADEVAATLADSGLGGPGGRGGHGPGMDVTVAAETLGMTEDELRTALEADGATLAQVAEDQAVEEADLVDALVAAGEERIADAVADGRLTQEEADERLADLEAQVTERVESPLPERPGGPGHD
jgi:polyhydroxyalkanoate synthesis regulator phasin